MHDVGDYATTMRPPPHTSIPRVEPSVADDSFPLEPLALRRGLRVNYLRTKMWVGKKNVKCIFLGEVFQQVAKLSC